MLWPNLVFVKMLVEQNASRNDPSIIPIMSQIEGLKDFHYWGGSQYYIQQADDNSSLSNGHHLNGEPRKNQTNTPEEEHKAHSLLVQYPCRPHFVRQLSKLRDSVKCHTVHYILPPALHRYCRLLSNMLILTNDNVNNEFGILRMIKAHSTS